MSQQFAYYFLAFCIGFVVALGVFTIHYRILRYRFDKQESKIGDDVLKLLEKEYDWRFYDSLTETGRELVKDTIDAHSRILEQSKNINF